LFNSTFDRLSNRYGNIVGGLVRLLEQEVSNAAELGAIKGRRAAMWDCGDRSRRSADAQSTRSCAITVRKTE